MKILKNTIRDLSSLGSEIFCFSERLSNNANYTARLDVRVFKYDLKNDTFSNNELFELTHLKNIFYKEDAEIDGMIEVDTYKKSKDFINLCLACGGGAGDGEFTKLDLRMASQEEVEFRITWFWKEVARYITLPPTRVYSHIPTQTSYFDEGIFWNFCFIYLDDENKQGIVLSGACFN